MKKFALLLSLCLVANVAFAQNTSSTEPEVIDRYYMGIGIQFNRIDEKTIGFSGAAGEYKNDHGQFTGKVVVVRLLKNGPAERAGIQTGDILVDVEWLGIAELDLGSIHMIIRTAFTGDETIHLQMRRTDVDGVALKDFEVEMKREKIDRVAWVPMNQVMRGEMSGGTTRGRFRLVFESKVTEDTTTGMFHLWSRVRNRGRIGTLLRWGMLERAMRGADPSLSEDFDMVFIALNPGKSREFQLVTREIPTYYGGSAGTVQAFFPAGDDYFRELKNEHGFYMTPTGVVTFGAGSSMPGFLPEAWVADK